VVQGQPAVNAVAVNVTTETPQCTNPQQGPLRTHPGLARVVHAVNAIAVNVTKEPPQTHDSTRSTHTHTRLVCGTCRERSRAELQRRSPVDRHREHTHTHNHDSTRNAHTYKRTDDDAYSTVRLHVEYSESRNKYGILFIFIFSL